MAPKQLQKQTLEVNHSDMHGTFSGNILIGENSYHYHDITIIDIMIILHIINVRTCTIIQELSGAF